MTEVPCEKCRLEWLLCVIIIILVTSASVMGVLGMISAFSGSNELAGGFVFAMAATASLMLLPVYFGLLRSCEKTCARGRCRCGCHTADLCSGKCHHWCAAVRESRQPEGPEEAYDCCRKCEQLHREDLFSMNNFDAARYGCSCVCHKTVTRMRPGVCACHYWCRYLYRPSE